MFGFQPSAKTAYGRLETYHKSLTCHQVKKLNVKSLIEFRRRTDRGKKLFIDALKSPKIEEPKEGGGDYWVSGLSGITRSFRDNDIEIVEDKIEEIAEKLAANKYQRTKDMYQRNIQILEGYKKIESKKLRPQTKLNFVKKSSINSDVSVGGLQIETQPSLYFRYGKVGSESVGSIWFLAKKGGYKWEELAMFCDIMFRSLQQNLKKNFTPESDYCIAVDVTSGLIIDYSKVEEDKLTSILPSTLDELKRML